MIKIIFEDNHLLVLNKPAGLLTQPTKEQNDSLLTRAKTFLKKRDQKPGNVFLEPIHRLDKQVSGIVVFAKTSKALARMMESIRERKCTKVYIAKVHGKVQQDEGKLEHYLIHGSHRAHVGRESQKGAKKAILSFEVIKYHKDYTLLKIELDTGRYHQIRAQLAALGHPIIGDVKYGSKARCPSDTIALQHQSFSIPHPITKEMISFDI